MSAETINFDEAKAMVEALSRYRDHRFAELYAICLQLAVESYPEEVRKSLGQVFDTRVIEDQLNRLILIASKAQEVANDAIRLAREAQTEAKSFIDGFRKDLETVGSDVGTMRKKVNNLAARVDRGAKFVDELAKKMRGKK